MTKAVILAGGTKSLDEGHNDFSKNKALVKIKDFPMVTYIINALLKVDEIEEVYVVGPEDSLNKVLNGYKVTILSERGTVLDNILMATEVIEVENKENILIVTSDIPLITPEAVQDFLSKCEGNYDLFYPVIEKEENDKKYPDLNRTFVRFEEGYFTGGNIFFINPGKVSQCYDLLNKIIIIRKKPFKLAMFLGLSFLFRLIMGNLSLKQVEKKVSSVLNISGKVVITSYPELGTDIDKEEDLVWLEKNI